MLSHRVPSSGGVTGVGESDKNGGTLDGEGGMDGEDGEDGGAIENVPDSVRKRFENCRSSKNAFLELTNQRVSLITAIVSTAQGSTSTSVSKGLTILNSICCSFSHPYPFAMSPDESNRGVEALNLLCKASRESLQSHRAELLAALQKLQSLVDVKIRYYRQGYCPSYGPMVGARLGGVSRSSH